MQRKAALQLKTGTCKRRCSVVFVLLFFALFSCDSSLGLEEPREWSVDATYPGGNNRGVFYLVDFHIGNNVAPTSAITKTLLADTTPHPQLSHGPVYAMRATLNNDFATSILIPVTNNSLSVPALYATAENIRVRDANGRTLYSTSWAYVYGSVGNYGVLDAVGQTDAYLAPRETGYISFGFFEDWHAVHSIEFSLDTSTTASVGQPAARVRPTVLKVREDANDQSMQVSFQNTGSTAAVLSEDGPVFYVLSDIAGVPIDWGFFSESIEPPDGRVDVDAYGSAMKPRLITDGAVRQVDVWIGFEDDASGRYANLSPYSRYRTPVGRSLTGLAPHTSALSDQTVSQRITLERNARLHECR